MEPIKRILDPKYLALSKSQDWEEDNDDEEVVVYTLKEEDRRRIIPYPRPARQLQPVQKGPYRCPRCLDQGFVRAADVPYGHPLFGKVDECSCRLAERRERSRQLLFDQSRIHELVTYQEESFETFQTWYDGVSEAYLAAKAFAESPSGWLVLAGPNGCGKTHLAVSIAKRCVEAGRTVLFAVTPDLLDYLRSTFSPAAGDTYDEEFRKMKEVEVLLLDDLGAESGTPWANEKLYQLFNHRYNARLPTVVTTNLIGFLGIAPRVRSRLCDRRLVKTITIHAADYRELDLSE